MRQIVLCILGALSLSFSVYGQKNSFRGEYEWMRKTFEQNDAGYRYIIDKKGEAAYKIHNDLIEERLKEVSTPTQFTALMNEWLRFFRTSHQGFYYTGEEPSQQTAAVIEPCFETVDVDIAAFRKYAASLTEPSPEGLWQLNSYIIGIRKEPLGGYVGFVVESGSEAWKPGQLKLTFPALDQSATLYMNDHTPRVVGWAELVGANEMWLGGAKGYKMSRIDSQFPDDPLATHYQKSRSVWTPYLDRVDASTLLLRIPDFDRSEKPSIDSVIKANLKEILSTETLIIDLRYNGGGADASFAELRPILYTNPVMGYNVEMLSTPLNNATWLELAKDPLYTDFARGMYEKLERNPGGFVPLLDEDVRYYRSDTVYAYPKNVGIIIHDRNASTTEEFLIAAKQSRKVKLFGGSTAGALDISNVRTETSPSGDYVLAYCISRSSRIPGFAIDDVGIQPDFFLETALPGYRWLGYATEIFNGK